MIFWESVGMMYSSGGFAKQQTGLECCGKSRKGEMQMINYEEELSRFQPSLEIDEAEEAIFHNDLTDIADIIETILKSGK